MTDIGGNLNSFWEAKRNKTFEKICMLQIT